MPQTSDISQRNTIHIDSSSGSSIHDDDDHLVSLKKQVGGAFDALVDA
jgi:hypothetical protein